MPPLRGDTELLVDIKGRNRDLLAAVAGSKAALKGLGSETTRLATQTRQEAREANHLNRALIQQRRSLQGLTGDYVALRRTVLSLGVRGAITGLDALTSVIEGTGQAVVELTASLGEAGAALGAVGVQSGAAFAQGWLVAKLALKNVAKTAMLTGKQYENAYAKLDRSQQDFLDRIKETRKGMQELRAIADGPIFDGFSKSLDMLKGRVPELKQIVYDTAQEIGYLSTQAAKAVNRQHVKLYALGERNALTMQRLGQSAIYLVEAGVQTLDGAGETVDRITKRAATGAKSLRNEITKLNQNGGLRSFFRSGENEAMNWLHTLKNVGTVGFGYIKAGQPIIDRTSDAIERQTKKWADWSKTQKGQKEMANVWERLQPVSSEVAKSVGATVAALGGMGLDGADNAIRILKGYREQVLPLLEAMGKNFNKNVLPNFIDLGRELVDFLRAARPGLEVLSEGFGGLVQALATVVGYTSDMLDNLSGVSKTLGGAIAPIALIAGWRTIKHLIEYSLLRTREMIGLAPARGIAGGASTATAIATTSGGARGATPVYGGARPSKSRYGGGPTVNGLGVPIQYGTNRSPITKRQQLHPTAPGEGFGRTFVTDKSGRLRERAGQMRPFAAYGYDPRTVSRYRNKAGRIITRATPVGGKPHLIPGYELIGSQKGARGALHPGGNDYAGNERGRTGRIIKTIPKGEGVVSRSGRVAAYRQFQNQNTIQTPKNFRERAGNTAGILTRNLSTTVAKETSAGLSRASQAMRGPMAKTLYFGAALSGTVQGVTTALHGGGLKNSIRDFISGATFGAMESSGSRDQRLKQGYSSLIDKGFKGPDSPKNFKADAKYIQFFRTSLKGLRDEGKLSADSFDFLSRKVDQFVRRANDIKSIKKQFGTLIDPGSVTGNLKKVAFGFDVLKQHTQKSLGTIKHEVEHNMREVAHNMDVKSLSGRDALDKNFKLGMKAVKRNIKDGTISVKNGMKAIRDMMDKDLALYGFTAKQRHNLMRGNNVSYTGGKEEGSADVPKRARGGLVTVGRKGEAGPDNVRLNAVVGRGEDVAVVNRHQRKALDNRLADVGGLAGFFRGNWPKHQQQYAGGGIVTLGNQLVKEGYEVSEQSHFGGVHPVHAKNSYHYRDQALDVNDDDAPGGEKASLDKLAAQLKKGGWHYLWQVADHFDHLHVDTASGVGGIGKLVDKIKELGSVSSNLPGVFGDLANSVLGNVRDAANSKLKDAVQSFGGASGSEVEGNIPGGKVSGSGAGLMRQISKARGWNFNDWWALDGTETGHGANMVNPTSSARLRGQFLDSNYGAYGPGSDPAQHPTMGQQIQSMAQYIDERYHNPTAAWAFHQAHNWYGEGGIVEASGGAYMSAPTLGGGVPDAPGPYNGKQPPKKKTGGGSGKPTRAMNPFTKKYETHTAKEWESIRERWARRGGAVKLKPKYGPLKITNKQIEGAKKNSGKLIKIAGGKKFGKLKPGIKIKMLKAALKGGKWPDDPEFYDNLTGEQLDVDQLPMFNSIRSAKELMNTQMTNLDALVQQQNESEEFSVVTLKGEELKAWAMTEAGGSLSAEDAAMFIQQNPDGFDVVNPGGLSGKRGINDAIAELQAQWNAHSDIDGNYLGQKGTAEGLDTAGAVQTRRDRLAYMKRIFDSNKKVQKRYHKKLRKMSKDNVPWKEQVADNDHIIDGLQDHLSISHRLPEKYKDGVRSEINDLQALNKTLREKKPTGASLGERQIQQRYNQKSQEQSILVGDGNEGTAWPGTGGLAASALNSLSMWKAMNEYRDSTITDAVQGDIAEKGVMSDLQHSIRELAETTGSKATVDKSQSDADKAYAADLQHQIDVQKMQGDALALAQFGSLRDFAQNVGMRFLGSFARGAVDVDKSGLALVHRNETIMPDQDGPFRNGMTMNALRSGGDSGPSNLTLVLAGDVAGLVRVVDARIDGKAANITTRQTGQKSRLIRAAG